MVSHGASKLSLISRTLTQGYCSEHLELMALFTIRRRRACKHPCGGGNPPKDNSPQQNSLCRCSLRQEDRHLSEHLNEESGTLIRRVGSSNKELREGYVPLLCTSVAASPQTQRTPPQFRPPSCPAASLCPGCLMPLQPVKCTNLPQATSLQRQQLHHVLHNKYY